MISASSFLYAVHVEEWVHWTVFPLSQLFFLFFTCVSKGAVVCPVPPPVAPLVTQVN